MLDKANNVKNNVYTRKGYKDRSQYLQFLSDEYGVDFSIVHSLSQSLGESEDFDGLIIALENAEDVIYE